MGFVESISIVTIMLLLCLYAILYENMEWDKINLEIVSTSSKLPNTVFLTFRCLFALLIFGTLIHSLTDEGITINATTREGAIKILKIKHFARLTFFTFWSWTLEGFYFLFTIVLSGSTVFGINLQYYIGEYWFKRLIELTWVLFEINFAVSFLVTLIVTFVLIPSHVKQGLSTDLFFRPVALCTHNANTIFMGFEIICNRMSFSFWHFAFAILFGLAYTLFSWYWYTQVGVFYYFFLDYAREDSLIMYIGLALTLTTFFFFGYWMSYLEHMSSLTSVAVVVLISMILKLRR